MGSPIYSLIFSQTTALGASFTDEERGSFLRKMSEVNSQYVDETLLMATCRFSDSSHQHVFINRLRGGYKEMVEGAIALEDIKFYQIFDIERHLGTLEEGAVTDFSPRPRYMNGEPTLFRITLFKYAPGYFQTPKNQRNEIFIQRERISDESGAKLVFAADSDWANEEWRGFSLEWFPNLAALQQFQQNLHDLEWARLYQSKTVLCYPSGGTLSPNPWDKR